MRPEQICQLLEGEILTTSPGGEDLQYGFASDLMSDVLTLQTDSMLLLTGLTTLQAVRTAEMSDIPCIIFVRGKKVPQAVRQLASDNAITLISTPFSMFRASGLLFEAGLKPIF